MDISCCIDIVEYSTIYGCCNDKTGFPRPGHTCLFNHVMHINTFVIIILYSVTEI